MQNVAAISELLKPYDPRLIRCYPVSSRLNQVANDDEECSRPVDVVHSQDQLFYSRSKPSDGIFLPMPSSARKRKFIVYIAVSADGFIARPDGAVDWLDRPRPKGNYGMGTFYRSIDTCILGRKTYDLSVSFGMAEGYAGKKNYVFSRTLSKAASPKVSVVSQDVTAFAERFRSEKGKDIWLVGGAEFVAAFLDAEQVDEFILHVIPTMIGEGIPLVASRHRTLPLKLLATRSFTDGVVKLHYAVGRQ
jgi:dihydrofolate reductase